MLDKGKPIPDTPRYNEDDSAYYFPKISKWWEKGNQFQIFLDIIRTILRNAVPRCSNAGKKKSFLDTPRYTHIYMLEEL